MIRPDLDFREFFGAPEPSRVLTRRQKRANRRKKLPPIERLRELFGYDTDYGGLFWQDRDGDEQYTTLEGFTVYVEGKHYAKWRIISMLVLGNSRGWLRVNELPELPEVLPRRRPWQSKIAAKWKDADFENLLPTDRELFIAQQIHEFGPLVTQPMHRRGRNRNVKRRRSAAQ